MKNVRIDFNIDDSLLEDVSYQVTEMGYKITKNQLLILVKNQLYHRGNGFIIEPTIDEIDIEVAKNNRKAF